MMRLLVLALLPALSRLREVQSMHRCIIPWSDFSTYLQADAPNPREGLAVQGRASPALGR
jgi:hypothetical protein